MSAAATALSEEIIQQAIAKGVSEVFETMTGEKIESLGASPTPSLRSAPVGIGGPHVVASVGFIGDIDGIINNHFDDSLALEVSSKMLGMTPEEVLESEVLGDATGELTNMIVGVFKNSLGDLGIVCKLTLPSIIRGNDFHLDPSLKNGRRHIYNFRCRGRAIVTDIIIQQD